jgi:Flp pilus assembly pilin Flp
MEVARLTRIVHKKEVNVRMKRVRAFVADDSGQGVVETVLIILILVLVIAAVFPALGDALVQAGQRILNVIKEIFDWAPDRIE